MIDGRTVHIEDSIGAHNASVISFADGGYTFLFNDVYNDWGNSANRTWETRVSANGTVATDKVFDQDSIKPIGESVSLGAPSTSYVSVYHLNNGQNIYLDVRGQNGGRITLKSLTNLPVGTDENCDIAALDNGNFVFASVENTGTTGILKAVMYSPAGILLGSVTLYAGNQPLANRPS